MFLGAFSHLKWKALKHCVVLFLQFLKGNNRKMFFVLTSPVRHNCSVKNATRTNAAKKKLKLM